MSVPRRMFEDPRNAYIVDNDDPGAFDKEFTGRPGVHREQRCCGDGAPVWQTHLINDEEEPGSQNRFAFRQMVGLQVEDATGASDYVTGHNQLTGYVWVEAPNSGYRPDFISPDAFMRWQQVYWMPSPQGMPGLPNPPRWVRVAGATKMRWTGLGGDYEFQWCNKCETFAEQIWSDILAALPTVARGIAWIASYVPVYGTAISFSINATVSLAEGESISQSVLDGIGGALPGQPESGYAFNAAVAIAKGERVGDVVIDALPLDQSVKDVLKAADAIVYALATGTSMTQAVYGAIRDRLPPEAQIGMDLARRVVNGEDVPEMVLSEAEQAVVSCVQENARSLLNGAKDQGAHSLIDAQAKVEALFNQYAAEFGYQMAFDRLSDDARNWLQLGLTGGFAKVNHGNFIGTFGSIPETHRAVNDVYAAQGEKLIGSGIRYKNRLVAQILNGSHFTITIDFFDSLNSLWIKREMTYTITDAWRRGFKVAIGACEGRSQNGPGQTAIYQSLADLGGRDGFEAGQAVQFDRTLHGDLGFIQRSTVNVHGNPAFFKAFRHRS